VARLQFVWRENRSRGENHMPHQRLSDLRRIRPRADAGWNGHTTMSGRKLAPYDALVSMAETNAEAKIGAHYQACVVRAKMRNGQLAESTLLYGSARPELQSGGVGEVMINYLIQLCGKPPH
jgi:hypothetical protein